MQAQIWTVEGLVNYVSKPRGKGGVKWLLLLEVYFITVVCRLEVLLPGSSPQVEKVFCVWSLPPPLFIISSLPSCAHVTGLAI